ncbi:ead/Ea22-like family protein [Klebsiella pneumoniae]|uniref:ead/Ea22-like family protein n=1 Tax=Klebsiella pneumoniae TaxID=573 RepID=UPI00110F8A59|nr:ead/Ea22-like family protein [Klebsiella pneumoniae]TMZ48838.1 ead/Ea22-like family protein [Klebsiella pneumoniae]TNA00203.1 ead/Ea22-like family protein [Klebsiella pneumoniae]TNA85477.1 ead/Ea22-like family protein [Klebsiella pneumoniae]
MTTDITELAQSLKAAAEKATQGEWWADEVKNEGCYGSGDDCVEGFTSYAIYGSDGQTLFDSLNSDAACISEEYDGEGHVAWDETAQRNAEFIALANPANVLALVEALEKAQQVDEELCKLLPPGVEYMDPPDGGDVTPLEGVRRMVADYRQLIAELESRTVKLPKPHAHLIWIQAGHAPDDYWDDVAVSHSEKDRCCDGSERYPVYARWEIEGMLTAAGIKVEAE